MHLESMSLTLHSSFTVDGIIGIIINNVLPPSRITGEGRFWKTEVKSVQISICTFDREYVFVLSVCYCVCLSTCS